MDRQWVLSEAEKLDQVLTRSSRADFSSFMQDSAVRPSIRPAAPAALQLGSTFRIGTLSAATVIRLEPRTKAAKGIMADIPEGRAAPRIASLADNNTVRPAWVARMRRLAANVHEQIGRLGRRGIHGQCHG